MTEAPTKIERNTSGIREVLFDQIDRLRNGDCDVGEAQAVAALVGQLDLPSPLKLEKK